MNGSGLVVVSLTDSLKSAVSMPPEMLPSPVLGSQVVDSPPVPTGTPSTLMETEGGKQGGIEMTSEARSGKHAATTKSADAPRSLFIRSSIETLFCNLGQIG